MCIEIVPSCAEAKNHAIWRLCKQDYKAPRYLVPALLISLLTSSLCLYSLGNQRLCWNQIQRVQQSDQICRKATASTFHQYSIYMPREQPPITRTNLGFGFSVCSFLSKHNPTCLSLLLSGEILYVFLNPLSLSRNRFSKSNSWQSYSFTPDYQIQAIQIRFLRISKHNIWNSLILKCIPISKLVIVYLKLKLNFPCVLCGSPALKRRWLIFYLKILTKSKSPYSKPN